MGAGKVGMFVSQFLELPHLQQFELVLVGVRDLLLLRLRQVELDGGDDKIELIISQCLELSLLHQFGRVLVGVRDFLPLRLRQVERDGGG